MTTQCPNCQSTHIENNICKNCKYHVFSFINDSHIHHKQNSDYYLFIDFLFERTFVDPIIIENIIKLDFLHIFSNCKILNSKNKDYSKNKLIVAAPYMCRYPNNYKNTIEFFFASFNYNDEYSLIPDPYASDKFIISTKENKLQLFLNISKDFNTNQYSLYINRRYIQSESIPYDIKLLNDMEYISLNKKFQNQEVDIRHNLIKYKYNIDLFAYSKTLNDFFLSSKIEIDFSNDFQIINIEFKKQMNIFLEKVDNLMSIYKENNKNIFERALTKIKLEGF